MPQTYSDKDIIDAINCLQSGMTVKQVAELSGIKRGTLSGYRSALSHPNNRSYWERYERVFKLMRIPKPTTWAPENTPAKPEKRVNPHNEAMLRTLDRMVQARQIDSPLPSEKALQWLLDEKPALMEALKKARQEAEIWKKKALDLDSRMVQYLNNQARPN